ncbi:MAG: hypothetical protein QM765_45240 [Myxococcales bacterium]
MNRWTWMSALVLVVALAACGTNSSSGSDAGTSGGTDATTGAGLDASTATGGDASLPPPATFDLTVAASCPFTKCGGVVLGTWDYTGLCVTEAELIAPLQSACSTATVTSITASGTGRLNFMATGHVSRKVEWTGTAVVKLPSACTTLLGGCAGTQATLRQIDGFASATCTGAGDCNCTLPISDTTDSIDSYTVTGSTVKVGDSDYEFCVSGSTFTYDDVSATHAELGVGTLTRRSASQGEARDGAVGFQWLAMISPKEPTAAGCCEP